MNIQMEETHRAGCEGRGAELPCACTTFPALSSTPLSQHLPVVTKPGSSLNPREDPS